MVKSVNRSKVYALAIAALVFTPQNTNAGGVPVFDASTFGQAVKQIVEMGRQLAEAQKQTGKLETIIADLTGPRGMSGLLNGAAKGTARRYANTELGSFIELASGSGGLSSSANGLEAAAQDIMATYGLRPGAEMIPAAPNGARARSIDLAQGTTLAAMTVGESAFNGARSRLTDIEGLIGAIDSTDDLKASVDLNTRMQGQVALLLNEMLTVQALQLRSTGVAMGLDAVTEENVVSTFGFDATQYGSINAPTEE